MSRDSPSNRDLSGEARGPGSLGGPGSRYSHGQTAHSSRKPRAGTPVEPGPLAPCPFPKRCRGGGGVPAGRGVPARRGVGVPARGILRPIRGQEAWEYHKPGPPNEPGPLAFSHDSPGHFQGTLTTKFLYVSLLTIQNFTLLRKAPDMLNFLRHVMTWHVRPKCSHRCVSLKETPFKTSANPQPHNQNLNRANRYENETVSTYRDLNCSGASPDYIQLKFQYFLFVVRSDNITSKHIW